MLRPRLFPLLLSFPFLLAAQDPEHAITSFQNFPARLSFPSPTFAIYHDWIEGNIYVSADAGKGWELAEGIPTGVATMLIEHPFDNSYAFVLTRQRTHYRTDDEGKTWRPFEVPINAALVLRPLSFHSDPKKFGYILYQGTVCDKIGWGYICHDETYMTKDAFSSAPRQILTKTSRCQFAHSSAEFKHDAHPDLIYCVAFTDGGHSLSSSRLSSSTDFFNTEMKAEDLGIGDEAKGVIAFAIVSKFGVVALKDLSPGSEGDMLLYVTTNTKTWAKARFPQGSWTQLRDHAYALVESTTYSLAVDVMLQDQGAIGTLFVSNSNGTFFVQSLIDTNRNEMGFVDYQRIFGMEGVGIVNVVMNADDVEGRGRPKQLKSLITFDDGSTWAPLRGPAKDSGGETVSCNTSDVETCSLHVHSGNTPPNFGRILSSPAPGFVIAVGSIGNSRLPYEESDTFLSTDGGVHWRMIRRGAHRYEFGDSGSILVLVNEENSVDEVRYSLDLGATWRTYNFGLNLRPRGLFTVLDSTSQKFLLLGQIARKDQSHEIGPFVIVYLDFANTRKRKCGDGDFEKWFARTTNNECVMGHKQWYKRRRPGVDCYVGEKFLDPVVHDNPCPCANDDYECDYNFVRHGDQCVSVGSEPIPAGACRSPHHMYMGSSGYRKIPGNTCTGGTKDKKKEKPCSQAELKEGDIVHQTFQFPSKIVQHEYLRQSTTILVRLEDHSIWQSSNEGYTWVQKFPEERFLAFYHHKYSSGRAYLITNTNKFYSTTDSGRTWNVYNAPTPPNTFRPQVLRFHPDSDKLIWTGNKDCDGPLAQNCHAEAQYSRDHGRHWNLIENYVVNCVWAKDAKLDADPTEILCESYRDKTGSQKFFMGNNPLALIEGGSYFSEKKKLFDEVIGFAKFSEFLLIARLLPEKRSLDLQVSLDGMHFATAMFPPDMHPETHAYTVLESSTGSIFLHMTMSELPAPYWGNILKSNSNGTYFGVSAKNVNRDERGYVDFEKIIGLDGIALINIVANPEEAVLTGKKALQTRITHNDGGTWKPLTPPAIDSLGNKYECQTVSCALHIHGYTERPDSRKIFSRYSISGVIIAVGNVGETLAPYDESDTFLSRDGGLTWEEVHKDAHLWEFGDSGSILVMANDEEPIDHVLFSTDEGLNWHEYQFSQHNMRIWSIVTVLGGTSRRFNLFGSFVHSHTSTVVHLDFTALTLMQCVINVQNPGLDDFELWRPSDGGKEQCLFGRQTIYHRRVRETNCIVGDHPTALPRIEKNCPCTKADFECEFNYIKNVPDECVLAPGVTPLPNDESCQNGQDYWYERTAYRKISFSTCESGERPDLGTRHQCPGFSEPPEHGSGYLWFIFILFPILIVAVVAYWYYTKSGLPHGTIYLPEDGPPAVVRPSSGAMNILTLVPRFVIRRAQISWEWTTSRFLSPRGDIHLPGDEDAQELRFEDGN
ncbi:vacuolar protein sorting/targeting protein 10 [Mycena maculata]|uniref:Vacuolar protein sorting/targeting protein 10 n=1 Tax=Mycena maculata TaxID=230809 RepID=A0AAD7JGD2_9AGAR|nr:vacuolar protein sorting/targeting protein 10 [Mycena maculata]